MSEHKTNNFLALLPLRNQIIFPKSVVALLIGRNASIEAIEQSIRNNQTIFITAQKHSEEEQPTEADVYHVGTRSQILQTMHMEGGIKVLVEGISRCKILSTDYSEKFMQVASDDVPTLYTQNLLELEAIFNRMKELYLKYTGYNPFAQTDFLDNMATSNDTSSITDAMASYIRELSFDERQKILELSDLAERMLYISELLKQKMQIIEREEHDMPFPILTLLSEIEKNPEYLSEQIEAIQDKLDHSDHE